MPRLHLRGRVVNRRARPTSRPHDRAARDTAQWAPRRSGAGRACGWRTGNRRPRRPICMSPRPAAAPPERAAALDLRSTPGTAHHPVAAADLLVARRAARCEAEAAPRSTAPARLREAPPRAGPEAWRRSCGYGHELAPRPDPDRQRWRLSLAAATRIAISPRPSEGCARARRPAQGHRSHRIRGRYDPRRRPAPYFPATLSGGWDAHARPADRAGPPGARPPPRGGRYRDAPAHADDRPGRLRPRVGAAEDAAGYGPCRPGRLPEGRGAGPPLRRSATHPAAGRQPGAAQETAGGGLATWRCDAQPASGWARAAAYRTGRRSWISARRSRAASARLPESGGSPRVRDVVERQAWASSQGRRSGRISWNHHRRRRDGRGPLGGRTRQLWPRLAQRFFFRPEPSGPGERRSAPRIVPTRRGATPGRAASDGAIEYCGVSDERFRSATRFGARVVPAPDSCCSSWA